MCRIRQRTHCSLRRRILGLLFCLRVAAYLTVLKTLGFVLDHICKHCRQPDHADAVRIWGEDNRRMWKVSISHHCYCSRCYHDSAESDGSRHPECDTAAAIQYPTSGAHRAVRRLRWRQFHEKGGTKISISGAGIDRSRDADSNAEICAAASPETSTLCPGSENVNVG